VTAPHTPQPIVRVDGRRFLTEDFHDIFNEAFGFPAFYGRNMNAWIDCLTSLDAPADGMTRVTVPKGGILASDRPLRATSTTGRTSGRYRRMPRSSAGDAWNRTPPP
jgi:hypothetical protein